MTAQRGSDKARVAFSANDGVGHQAAAAAAHRGINPRKKENTSGAPAFHGRRRRQRRALVGRSPPRRHCLPAYWVSVSQIEQCTGQDRAECEVGCVGRDHTRGDACVCVCVRGKLTYHLAGRQFSGCKSTQRAEK